MQFTVDLQKSLKDFIIKRLSSISAETDPDMLADYIVVLLKHDKTLDVLKADCLRELSFFLKNDTEIFVSDLFSQLTRKEEPPKPIEPINERDEHGRRNRDRRDNRDIRREKYSSSSSSDVRNDRYSYNNNNSGSRYSDRPDKHSDRRDRFERFDRDRGVKRSYDDEDEQMEENGQTNKLAKATDISTEDLRAGTWTAPKQSMDENGNTVSEWEIAAQTQPSNAMDVEEGPLRGREYFSRRTRRGDDRRGDDSRRGRGRRENNFQQRKQEPSKKVQIYNIPEENCTQEVVEEFFSKFGKIQSTVLYPLEQRAIVEYSTLKDSLAAFNTQEAPFNNRFVKLGWFHDRKTANEPPKPQLTVEERQKKLEESQKLKEQLISQMEDLQKKQEIHRQELIAKLAIVPEEDKAEILKSLKAVTQVIVDANSARFMNTKTPPDQESERMRLDTELDLLQKVKEASKKLEQETTEPSEEEELKRKLETLKEEHAALGLNQNGSGVVYRGGGRGGSVYRGRGRGSAVTAFAPATRGAFKLDLRPRQLKVSEFPLNIKSQLRTHFEHFGTIENFVWTEDGNAIVKFSKRWEAEQALKNGKFVEQEGGTSLTLSVDWNVDKMPDTFMKHESGDFKMEIEDEEEEESAEKSWKR